MGATPWRYFVQYDPNPNAAFVKLKREMAGADNFSPDAEMEEMDLEDSMSMLLSVMTVTDSPGMCSICPLSPQKLQQLFGTTEPTRDMIESNRRFFDDIERGEGIYIVAYKDGKPDEYCFAGYSFD